jgi:hypothetical protein
MTNVRLDDRGKTQKWNVWNQWPLPNAKITIEVKGYAETKWTSTGGVWTNDPDDSRENIVPIGKKLFTVSQSERRKNVC